MNARSTPLFRTLLVVMGLSTLSSCQQPSPTAQSPESVASIEEIMADMVMPSAERLWQVGTTVSDETGTHDLSPKTEAEWAAVHSSALMVAEAANLIAMEGRHAEQPARQDDPPEEGVLTGTEIDAAITADRPAFARHAREMQDLAREAAAAAERRDSASFLELGGRLDAACESCHLQYWYPKDLPRRQRAS